MDDRQGMVADELVEVRCHASRSYGVPKRHVTPQTKQNFNTKIAVRRTVPHRNRDKISRTDYASTADFLLGRHGNRDKVSRTDYASTADFLLVRHGNRDKIRRTDYASTADFLLGRHGNRDKISRTDYASTADFFAWSKDRPM